MPRPCPSARPGDAFSDRLFAEELGVRALPAGVLAVGTDAGTFAVVRTYADDDNNGTYERLAGAFPPFGGGFKGGVRVATADFNGDKNSELITASGAGAGTVKIWELNSDGSVGTLISSFLPFGPTFKGGLFVAAGDLNFDGRDELAVSMGGDGNRVVIYSDSDNDGQVFDNQTDTFNPFGSFTGGTRLAMGNTDGSNGTELVVGRGPGGPATVRIYTDSDSDRAVSDHPILESFTAFGGSYSGGVFLACGHISGAGTGVGAEVIVGRGSGVSTVKIYTDSNTSGTVSDNALFDSFAAFGTTFKGGVRVAAGDSDHSGNQVEVITGAGPGNSLVRIRDDSSDAGVLLSDNPATDSFTAFPGFTGGVFVAFGEVENAAFANLISLTIPDGGSRDFSIFVPHGAGIIRDLNVGLGLTHTNNADLDVTLTHVASGVSIQLFADVGHNDDGFNILLNQTAGTDIGNVADSPTDLPVTGQVRPAGTASLNTFTGLDASGLWRLTVADDTATNSGSLLNWTLLFGF